MKTYTGKTIEEALENASIDLGKSVDDLVYSASEKKGGFLKLKQVVEVNVYELTDIIRYAEDYILGVCDSIGIESSTKTRLDDDIIRITIDSTHNPILIGKNGKTLQALNELTKIAVSNHFHHRFRILLDIGGYKDHKYMKLKRMARKYAYDVQKTKTEYTFDPMPADERRAIHNACGGIEHVKTESTGEGTHRQVHIVYVD